jgi:hypothetical protein
MLTTRLSPPATGVVTVIVVVVLELDAVAEPTRRTYPAVVGGLGVAEASADRAEIPAEFTAATW